MITEAHLLYRIGQIFCFALVLLLVEQILMILSGHTDGRSWTILLKTAAILFVVGKFVKNILLSRGIDACVPTFWLFDLATLKLFARVGIARRIDVKHWALFRLRRLLHQDLQQREAALREVLEEMGEQMTDDEVKKFVISTTPQAILDDLVRYDVERFIAWSTGKKQNEESSIS